MSNTNNSTNLKLIETFYDEAKTKVNERYFVDENYLRQGLYESFYENGQLEERYTFKNDELDGLFKKFNRDGDLIERCTYKDGLKQGLYESFDENGQLEQKCMYKDDKPWHSVINTVNKKVACKPIELRKSFNEQIQLSTFSNKQMLELEVLFDNENKQFKKGDKIYLSKELEYNDHAMWLKTVYVVKEEPCIFVPEEFIYVHERS